MTGPKKRDGENSEGDSGFVTPDSTTREKVGRFVEGEDILSLGKDGIFYLGRIVVVNPESERCLVQFEDSTAHWSLYKDLSKVREPESDELCFVCKSSKSSFDNEIVLCYICDKGYHQKCLQPEISTEFVEGDEQWECPRCVCEPVITKQEKRKSREGSPRKKPRLVKEEDEVKRKLPYEIHMLSWDNDHKTNKEQTYCYCGGPGEWFNRMLQCRRCYQWFHEACVDCIHYPLLYGDRFYVYLCNFCNEDCEFLHRLDTRWVDVVHLALFNLMVADTKKYFDFELKVLPWINDNWENLQCPLELQKVCVSDRKAEVLNILKTYKPRFKGGRETHKKCSLYALRVKVPPPVPVIHIPAGKQITDEVISEFELMVIRDGLSPPIPRCFKILDEKDDISEDSFRYSPAKKRPSSPIMVMHLADADSDPLGRRKRKREVDILMEDKKAKKMIDEVDNSYQVIQDQFTAEPLDLDAFSPCDEQREKPKSKSRLAGTRMLRDMNTKGKEFKDVKIRLEKIDFDSTYLPPPTPKSCESSGDDTSSHNTLDAFIPRPSNFEGQNNPFLNLDSISYGLPLMRPLKRKLSENDIKIGKNGQIKRRRFRRKCGNVIELSSSRLAFGGGALCTKIVSGSSSNAGVGDIKNCVSYALNGRFEQGSQLEDSKELVETVGLATSPRTESGGYTFSELKSTVNTYFGAVNRIAYGETFNILGRRITSDGRMHCLLEWKAPR